MKNKYQVLFWVWIISVLIAAFFLFLPGIYKPFDNRITHFFNITIFLLISLFLIIRLSPALSSTVDELAAKARKQLPWTEYFDLKRDTKIPLDRNDEKLAAEKVEANELPDFLSKFTKHRELLNKFSYFLIGYVLIMLLFNIFFLDRYTNNSGVILLVFLNIICSVITCFYLINWELPLQIHRFCFAKKIDHLIAQDKLKVWK
jgi:hypothetical protein